MKKECNLKELADATNKIDISVAAFLKVAENDLKLSPGESVAMLIATIVRIGKDYKMNVFGLFQGIGILNTIHPSDNDLKKVEDLLESIKNQSRKNMQ